MAMKARQCQMCHRGVASFGNCTNSFGETQTYTLVQSPRSTVQLTNLQKTCQPMDQPPPFGNLMFDRRIVRGSTFATPPVLICNERSQAARQAEARKRQVMRKHAQLQSVRATLVRIGTPPPVPRRKHEPVQTELFLEELFDYDVEVQPILEILVGRTIEQAFMEVLEEEEIAILREQQRKFLELRAAEKAEQQRLEEQDRRIREEKNRRVREHEEALKVQLETEERVAAAVLLTGYIAELLPQVLESLKISGFLLDEIKSDVEEEFMPWLMKEVKREMGNVIESREILEGIIRDIIEMRAKTYEHSGADYDASKKLKAESFGDVCEQGEQEHENSLNRYTDDTDMGSER